MSEIALQTMIQNIFESNQEDWWNVWITNFTSDAHTSSDLIGERKFKRNFRLKIKEVMVCETRSLSVDLIGGMRPNIVLSSNPSGRNRIIIEVNRATKTTHKVANASHFVRYFLHFLVTSDRKPKSKEDIARGLFLASPTSWLENPLFSHNRRYLLNSTTPSQRHSVVRSARIGQRTCES